MQGHPEVVVVKLVKQNVTAIVFGIIQCSFVFILIRKTVEISNPPLFLLHNDSLTHVALYISETPDLPQEKHQVN